MSTLVVGLSHHTTPISVLERCALSPEAALSLGAALVQGAAVQEAAVLATCNRLEVYAEVASFHGGLAEVGAALVRATGLDLAELSPHLFAHHGDEAVRHLFTVACGMDSMALGESQVLGQVREMLSSAQRENTVGRVLDPLFQRALHVGKRAFGETGLARTGHSLVGQALGHAEAAGVDLTGARALVIGAGAMSSLAGTTLRRAGVGQITIANRSFERAVRLAEQLEGTVVGLESEDFGHALAHADVVITCTGATSAVLSLTQVAHARQQRAADAGAQPASQLIIDLALPHDVAPEVASLPGVTLVGLASLHEELSGLGVGEDLAAVKSIIDAEVDTQLRNQAADRVAPTVVALRAYAEQVVETELARLRTRVADLDPRIEAELERAVHRVVEKLLHRPTVRVKALGDTDPTSYAGALAALFDLQIDTDGGTSLVGLAEALAVEVTS